MSQLPLDGAIKRIQANDERLDVFANGTDTQSYQASSGSLVPSIRKFLKEKDDEINAAADSILSDSQEARDAAQASAQAADADAAVVSAQVGALAAPTGAATVGTAPAGGLSATNVQAALNELDTEKATAASVALKAPIESPAFTGTVTGITKAMVGLGLADNTADADKPVSTPTASALLAKEDKASKDASGGYVGLDLFKIKLRNAANTVTSFFTTAATAPRTWTMPDKSGTVALLDDGGGLAPVAEIILGSAVANIDFLNVFTSAYDRYLVTFDDLRTSTGATDLRVRAAVAGAADATNSYAYGAWETATNGVNQSSMFIGNTDSPISSSATGSITFYNCNSVASNNVKRITSECMGGNSSAVNVQRQGIYVRSAGAAVLSGFRLLLSSGVNFETGAKVRVYGYKKT